MTEDKGILIRNVYYMLSYAFQVLRRNNYEDIAKEEFERIQDLFAEILFRGMSNQLKQGLYKEYVPINEQRTVLKGKLDMPGTIMNRIKRGRCVSCDYDELSVNNIYNQIIRTTAERLIKEPTVDKARKSQLRSIMPFFDGIDLVDLKSIRWKALSFQRNNRSYEMLLNLCYFVIDGMLMTTEAGEFRMTTFSDEHMNRLFEHFVLEYYRKEFSGELTANAAVVDWAIDNDKPTQGLLFMPKMQTDIMLKRDDRTLIIDTKYYGKMMQTHFDKTTIHQANLYQIMTYVSNEDRFNTGNASGMLLYARTQESVSPDVDITVKANRILVKTLDLNRPFDEIRNQLDSFLQYL